MLSRGETGRKKGKQESAGKVLEKPLPKPSFAGSGTASLASGRTPPSKPKSRPDLVQDFSQKEKKSLWNWKSLKVLTNSKNKKFKCCFSLKVHTIIGLPSRFESSSLRVHWRMRDNELSTRSYKVIERTAEFDESLTHNCVVHARSSSNHSAKYDAKQFTLFPSVVGAKHLDLGKHKVELTRLFPLTLEELEDEKSIGTWATSFKLSGEARGAVINVSFGYSVIADSSASNGNRRIGDESASAKQIVTNSENVMNRGDSLLSMLVDNSHEFPTLGEDANTIVKIESPACSDFDIELKNDGKQSYEMNVVKDFPLNCSELGFEAGLRDKLNENSVEAAIVGNKSRDWIEAGANATSEMILTVDEVNHDESVGDIESLLVENHSHDLSDLARLNPVNEKMVSSFSDLDHGKLQETVAESLTLKEAPCNVPKLDDIDANEAEIDEQTTQSSILGRAHHDISKEVVGLDANEIPLSPFSEVFCGVESSHLEFNEQAEDTLMLENHSHNLSSLDDDGSTINEISLLNFSDLLDEMEESNGSHNLSESEGFVNTVYENSSPTSDILSETEVSQIKFDGNTRDDVGEIIELSPPACSEVVTESGVSQNNPNEGATFGDNFSDVPKLSDVMNAIDELLSATNTIYGTLHDKSANFPVFHDHERSEFSVNEFASEEERSYDKSHKKLVNSAILDNNHNGSSFINQTESISFLKPNSEKGLSSDSFHGEKSDSVFLNSSCELEGDSFDEVEREIMFKSINSHEFTSEIDVKDAGFEEREDNEFSGSSNNGPFESLSNYYAYPEGVDITDGKAGDAFAVPPENISDDSVNSAEQKQSLFLGEDAEDVENDFLDMLGIKDAEDQPESPRECLLREFEKDGFSFLDIDNSNPQETYDRFCISDEFDLDSILRDMEQVSSTPSKKVDDKDPEMLTRDFVFNEDSFQSPQPTACHVEVPAELPPLGEGLGSFVQTKNGGFLRSMSPNHFSKEGSLIMQVSSPVVIPAELGSDANHIIQGLASIGLEKLSMQANKLMPLDDIAGKTMHQVAFEAGASQVKSNHANNECVTLDELAPLAMEKIEALSMEGLKFQSGASECSHLSSDGTAGVRLLPVNESSGEVDGLMGMSLSLDQWMRLDSGDFGNENEAVSEETSKILAAHRANSLDSIRGKKRGKRSGLLGNTFTVSLLVQLRDPLRDFEAVGTPMLALVQVERVFTAPKPKIYYNVSSNCRKEDEEIEEVKEVEKFVISDVHVAGLENESGKEKLWGTENQHKCGSRWLLANGMGKNNKSGMPSKGPSKDKAANTMWSLSSKSNANPSVSKWGNAAKMKNNQSWKLR